MYSSYSFVLGCQFITDNSRLIFRAIIYHKDFKIGIGLISDGTHATRQIFFYIIDWDNNANLWLTICDYHIFAPFIYFDTIDRYSS